MGRPSSSSLEGSFFQFYAFVYNFVVISSVAGVTDLSAVEDTFNAQDIVL